MSAAYITRIIHTRAFGVGVALVVAVCAFLFYFNGYQEHIVGDRGVALPSANMWLPSPDIDFSAGVAAACVTVLIMALLNKVYNVLRSMTSLYIALFAAMELATPDLLTQFYTGSLLAVVVPLCLFWLFSCYRNPLATRHIFLIFLLLSFFTATQYCFALYAVVFLLGMAQMQVFNGRSFTAAMLGIITPWWIMLGFGIITPADIRVPEFVSIFSVIDLGDTFMLLITVGITGFAMLVCYILNLLKTIAYNARTRAYNGAFTVTALVTLAAMCIDYPNIISYVPLLNFSAAMEIAHFFSTHRAEKSFIAIAVLLAAYAALFICQTVI